MSNETYRRFDPRRTAPVKEVRKQIVASHYFNVDHVAFNSSEVGHSSVTWFRRTVETPLACCRHRTDKFHWWNSTAFPLPVGRWKFRRGMPFP